MYEFYLIMDVEKTYVNINLIVLYAKTNIIIASIVVIVILYTTLL